MTHKAIVLGCGMMGATMAKDLAADPSFDVTVADLNPENLRKASSGSRIKTIPADLGDSQRVRALVAGFDLVLGALPSAIGLQTLRAVIESGKPYCDITFMPEDAVELDALAKQHGVTAVVDCGVSPGLSNLMVGHAYARLDHTERADTYVGGLPKLRRWPYDYKAPFAPGDVIEEYTRPARLVEHGKVVVRPALSEPELMDFPRVGTLEAFNTDGLRSLLRTVNIPHMREKTLRYPGHIDLMRVLRETGFFDTKEIDVRGAMVRPRDLTAKLLFPLWAYAPGEGEYTVLRVVVEGTKDGQRMRYTYDLYDEYNQQSGTSSMARTTAFPCAIVARLLAQGRVNGPGVLPPELLATREGVFDHIINELNARGVAVTVTTDGLT